MTFKKMLKQREDAEYEDRMKELIKYLNIETSHYQSDQGYHTENNEFVDVIQRINYLDCSGLEQQSNSFDPFFLSSVDDFNVRIANYEVFRKMGSWKSRLILSTLFSAYTKETLLQFKPRNITFMIRRCLEYAIENQNHILVIELVRSYIFDFDLHLSKVFVEKEINSVVMDTFLTTAKYSIFKQYPRLKQNFVRLSFCRECSPESRLVIMMIYNGSIEIKDEIPEKVMGVQLVLHNYTQPSDEASAVFHTIAASCLSKNLPIITEKDARKLFKKHSNLTLISASPYKSSGYSKGNHIIVEKHCISLLCLHKGYIPFGEREFPKQINGFDVDVQEGYCSLGRSVDSGGHIRRARGINTPGNGSIGGFVDLPDGSVGLITCAHVVFSTEELKIPNTALMKYVQDSGTDLNVETFDRNQNKFQVCGSIVDKCFPLSSSKNSVDAALIKLDPSVNEFKFPVTDQLYSAGFDPHTPPTFTGEVISVPNLDPSFKEGTTLLDRSIIPGRLDSVVKFGSQSGFTKGNLFLNGTHVRFVDEYASLPDHTCVLMCNQIEIQSLPHGTFFEMGDSGAFVFCINPDKTLSCLGMAIGTTSKGACFVTPMDRILDTFGLPHRLKPFSPKVSGETSSLSEGHPGLQSVEQGNT